MVSTLTFLGLLAAYLLVLAAFIEANRRNKRLIELMKDVNETNAALLISLEWAHDTIARMREQERDN